jgi:hypothetical protein
MQHVRMVTSNMLWICTCPQPTVLRVMTGTVEVHQAGVIQFGISKNERLLKCVLLRDFCVAHAFISPVLHKVESAVKKENVRYICNASDVYKVLTKELGLGKLLYCTACMSARLLVTMRVSNYSPGLMMIDMKGLS